MHFQNYKMRLIWKISLTFMQIIPHLITLVWFATKQ